MTPPAHDVVELRHMELQEVLARAARYILHMAQTFQLCQVIGCMQDCEICEKAFMDAQEARRDVLRFVDTNYSQNAFIKSPTADVSR